MAISLNSYLYYATPANLERASLCRAVLVQRSAQSLIPTNLTAANLQGADLSYADLSGVILQRANLLHADLTGTILNRADLTGATMPDGSVHD